MSKKPQFWEKIKKTNRTLEEPENHDVIHNTVKGKKNNLDVRNSCSDTSLPLQNSHEHIQNHTTKEKVIRKKSSKCDTCENIRKSKCTIQKTEKCSDNSSSAETKLNLEYIDNLVSKIKELKNRVKYIENHCYCGTVDTTSPKTHHQRESKQIGDYDELSFRKLHNNHKDVRHNHGDNSSNFTWIDNYKVPFQHKFSSFMKNIPDQKSIYTANEHTLPETYYKVSKNQKNKSNTSLIMSLHSTSKNNFVKVSPLPDSKHFQAAAEEFIQQAEELKGKIGYILECCGFNHLSSISDASESIVPSEYNHSLKSSSKACAEGLVSDRDLKFLFRAVNSQYSEILNSLMAIEQQVNSLNQQKASKPRTSSTESMCLPKTTVNSNNKVNTRRGHKCNTAVSKNCFSEDPNKLSRTVTKKHSAEVKPSYVKARKDSRSDKCLEPVVMVYEPILPEYDVVTGMGACKYCGKDLTNCAGCDEDTKTRPKKGTSKHKREEEKTQKYGFVVTYTPDISSDVNVTPSTSEASTKTKTKEKKKIIPCLWF